MGLACSTCDRSKPICSGEHGGCLIQVIYVVHRAVAVVNWFWLAWRTKMGQNPTSPGSTKTSNATQRPLLLSFASP